MTRIFQFLLIGCFALAMGAAAVLGNEALAGGTLEVREAWLRAPLMEGRPAAGYFKVNNTGDSDLRLVGVTSLGGVRVEMHENVMDGDRMMMRPVNAVTIPAQGSVVFEPHGYHLMLFGLPAIMPEDRVMLTLRFDGHSPISVSAMVVAAGDGNPYPGD